MSNESVIIEEEKQQDRKLKDKGRYTTQEKGDRKNKKKSKKDKHER